MQGGRVAVKVIECQGDAQLTFPSGTSISKAGGDPETGCARAAVVEALLARCLSHPHIVTTFSFGLSACEQVGWRLDGSAVQCSPVQRSNA